MHKDYNVFFGDILASIDKIKRYTDRRTFEEFANDDMAVDAVLRNLEIIGEAAKSIPADVRKKHASIEWRKIIGLRNILIHAYSGVDMGIVWDIVKNKLPLLERDVRRALEEK